MISDVVIVRRKIKQNLDNSNIEYLFESHILFIKRIVINDKML